MSRSDLLVIDLGSASLGDALHPILADQFHVVAQTVQRQRGREICDQLGQRFLAGIDVRAIVLLDDQLDTGISAVVRSLRSFDSTLPILLVTESYELQRIMDVLQCGVTDFVVAPFNANEILPRLWRLIGSEPTVDSIKLRLKVKLGLKHLIGSSPVFMSALEKIPIYARHDGTVLIEGETGTGKGVCARAIHHLSPRSGGPFVPVNCGAIPLELIENELFGHTRGAFTSAATTEEGLIQHAEGGTLFLDEIDCLPTIAQVKLLRLLQEREYRLIGSAKTRSANIRLIAATNTDIIEAVRQKRLRQDFYYRLNVLPITMPALRERQQDVLLLANHFLSRFAAQMKRTRPSFSPGVTQLLLMHDWPGNVREVEHVIERAVILSENRPVITEADVQLRPPNASLPSNPPFQAAKAFAIARFERTYIENLLMIHKGNVTHAAHAAQKNRRAFWELIRKHGIVAEQYRVGTS